MQKIKVIAEIANAHQGDADILYSLLRAASDAGADGVKFQWFKYDHLAVPDYPFYKNYEELFISENEWEKAVCIAKNSGLEVWIDIFDDWGLELASKFASIIDGLKIPSTIIQSDEIIKGIFSMQKPVLLGIGGWHESEIYDFLCNLDKKSLERLIIIHGFQGYPTKTEDANLVRINYLKERFKLQVGFADHEDGAKKLAIDLPIYAVFAGATLIEKHITLDRSKKGYDYYSALEPHEFAVMVSKLREIEIALGTIEVNESERSYLKDALRVTAGEDVEKGEILTLNKVAYKRCSAEKALMPRQFTEKGPMIAKKNIKKNEPITLEFLEKPKIAIAVVCRLKSTRLPKKAVLPLNGITSIERCLLNCLAVPNVEQVVLATSYLPEDDPLEQFALDGKVKVLRGDPDNVLKRLIQAAHETEANIVLRVTGDCPAVSPEILNILIEEHLKNGGDLTIPTAEHATGTAADVYTVWALYRLLSQKKSLTHTEYLSFYYINNPALFSVNKIQLPRELRYPQWRLTLDEQKDWELFEQIYRDLDVKREPLFFADLRNYLLDNPQLARLNSHIALKWKDNKTLVEEISKATSLDI
ncbi:MAG: N-acetylneuraminate synthase family protein [Dethiobacter sp.]|jgi:N,N'-diacetyllegionaminate synthase|nr:N-acetylneuraminate synthase family protein [Dethiobacter sp.]